MKEGADYKAMQEGFRVMELSYILTVVIVKCM